jgi:hypothetical protein
LIAKNAPADLAEKIAHAGLTATNVRVVSAVTKIAQKENHAVLDATKSRLAAADLAVLIEKKVNPVREAALVAIAANARVDLAAENVLTATPPAEREKIVLAALDAMNVRVASVKKIVLDRDSVVTKNAVLALASDAMTAKNAAMTE